MVKSSFVWKNNMKLQESFIIYGNVQQEFRYYFSFKVKIVFLVFENI